MKKKLLSILLTITMIATFFPASAFAAQSSGTASTLRLEKTEGTVAVENASGKDVSVKSGLRLYNGYGVETKSSSYAWISLDKAKAIKLDASSKSSVSKNGKKLEVLVHSGKLFCNVSEPLKADESLTIRTSTMVTGVRGTSFYVEVLADNIAQVNVLEGTMDVYSIDPATKETRVTTVTGGQTITLVYDGEIPEELIVDGLIKDGEIAEDHIIFTGIGLRVEELQEKDVPGYVAVEIAKDPELQEKIENNSPLSVPEIIGDAQERLDADEKEAEAEEEAIQEQLEQQEEAEQVDNLFGEQTNNESSSGGGGTTAPASTTLTGDVTAADIIEAWKTYDVVNVSNAPNLVLGEVESNTQFTVPGGKTLNLGSATEAKSYFYLNIDGTMNLNEGATLTNADVGNLDSGFGCITVNSDESLHINSGAVLNNNGNIIIGSNDIGKMTISGTVNNNGDISIGSSYSGIMTIDGTMNNHGEIYVGSDDTLLDVVAVNEGIAGIADGQGETTEDTELPEPPAPIEPDTPADPGPEYPEPDPDIAAPIADGDLIVNGVIAGDNATTNSAIGYIHVSEHGEVESKGNILNQNLINYGQLNVYNGTISTMTGIHNSGTLAISADATIIAEEGADYAINSINNDWSIEVGTIVKTKGSSPWDVEYHYPTPNRGWDVEEPGYETGYYVYTVNDNPTQ